jgi:hypothetical protein
MQQRPPRGTRQPPTTGAREPRYVHPQPPYTAQVMSEPQHIGDLIIPCPFGHFDTCTVLPSSFVRVSCTSSAPQLPHVMMPTLIPQVGQVYRAISIFLCRVSIVPAW